MNPTEGSRAQRRKIRSTKVHKPKTSSDLHPVAATSKRGVRANLVYSVDAATDLDAVTESLTAGLKQIRGGVRQLRGTPTVVAYPSRKLVVKLESQVPDGERVKPYFDEIVDQALSEAGGKFKVAEPGQDSVAGTLLPGSSSFFS